MQCRSLASFVAAFVLLPLTAAQALIYDEAIDGEFAFQSGSPPQVTVTLDPGVNRISGTLTKTLDATDADPFFAIVPDGLQIESIRYDYSINFTTQAGVATYLLYIDQNGNGLTYEVVEAATTPTGSRTFYADFMPLGPATYTIGRQGSGIATDNVYTLSYFYTITVSGDAPPPDISIDSTDFCVDDEFFHFDVTVTGDNGELSLQVGADGDPAVTPVERIAAYFNAQTGVFSDGEPMAESFGSPPADRWLDGSPDSYDLVSAGGTSWRLSGRVRHGADPFVAGDSLWGVRLGEGSTTEQTGALPIAACPEPPPPPQKVTVPFVYKSPVLDGQIGYGEWQARPQIQLPNGTLTFVHDETRLYVLANLRGDRSQNSIRDGGPDELRIVMDADEDGAVTPNIDGRFRMLDGTGNFRLETFASGSGFNAPRSLTFSALADGFGCFLADGSLKFAPAFTCDNHRVYEVGLDLLEIQASADKSVKLGIEAHTDPGVSVSLPDDLADFAGFLELELEYTTNSDVRDDPTLPISSATLQVAQGPPDVAGIDFVAGRDAYLRVAVFTPDGGIGDIGESVTVNVFASRDGVDLPGYPYATYLRYSSGWSGQRSGTLFRYVKLPAREAWGDVELRLFARQPVQQISTTGPARTVSFRPTRTPTYWIVPINTGSAAAPDLPGNTFLERSELEVRASFPVADIDFVRRPALVTSPATKDDAITALNQYDQQALLAWTLGLLITGESPFALPDQVIGAFPASTGYGTTIGMADPRWYESGNGRVLWLKEVDARAGLLLPHELNHNLDLDTSGTWGRHILGCRADGLDPQWPYGTDLTIQAQAFVTEPVLGESDVQIHVPRLVDPEDMPDYMSYCRKTYRTGTDATLRYPYQWLSPYRWQRQLDEVFALPQSASVARLAVQATPPVQDALYVNGEIRIDGTGALGPVLTQPAVVPVEQRSGEYAIRVADCADATLVNKNFGAIFEDVEGQPRATVPFAFVLPDPGGVCAVQLRRGSEVLAERLRTPNAPRVTLLAPNGGESWSGLQTVRWLATDDDGGPLTATLQFSPDGGLSWLPLAGNLEGDAVQVNSATLPGTDQGLVRVVVTDGLNTAVDMSDSVFAVAPSPPAVEILLPGVPAEAYATEPVTLSGVARDALGNRLPVEGFVWTVDGEAVGVGNPVDVALEPGLRQVTLSVSGDGGLVGLATIELMVFEADVDRDGVPDQADACTDAIVSPLVTIQGCETGVSNQVSPEGCSLTDQTYAAFEAGGREGAIVFLKALWRDGTLTRGEEKAIRQCLPDSEDADPDPDLD